MRALGLLGSLAIGCLVTLSCGSDDNKGDGGTGGSTGTGGSAATGGSTGTGGSAATGGSTGTGGSAATGGTTGTGGSAGGGNAKFACDYNMQGGAHFCWTWDAGNVPSPQAVIAAWQSACTQGMGMTVTACPTSGAVGKCTFTSNSGGYSVSQTVYYYPPVTAATGMQLCMANNVSGVTATWTSL